MDCDWNTGIYHDQGDSRDGRLINKGHWKWTDVTEIQEIAVKGRKENGLVWWKLGR